MAQDEIFEKLFNEMIDEAARQMSEQDHEDISPAEVHFSPEHEKKMQELFQKERRKNQKKHSAHTKRLLCVLIACMIVSVGGVCSVGAWRIRLMNFFFTPENPNTTFTFNDDHSYVYSDKEVYLNYVPEGFVLTDRSDNAPVISRTFSKEDKFFEFSIYSADGRLSLDTESGALEEITMHGLKGVTTSSNLVNSVILYDDNFVYCFTGNIAQNEIIKIAQGYQK